jgi:DNA-binding transcriptional LysR family regulator
VCTPALWASLGEDLTNAPVLQAHTLSSPRGAQPAMTWASCCHITLRGTITSFNRQSMAIMAAAQGEGVAVVPYQMACDMVKRGALIQPVPESCPDQMSYYLVWSARHARAHVISMLSDWLSTELSTSLHP